MCELLRPVLKPCSTGRVSGVDKSDSLCNVSSRQSAAEEQNKVEDFSIMTFEDCWVLKVRKFPIPFGALGIKCQGH